MAALRNAFRPASAMLRPTTFAQPARRTFQTSQRMMQDSVVVKKPVGAFRGTQTKKQIEQWLTGTWEFRLFGFLLGSVLAGGGLYYYVVDEYKVSNELLTEDIYALQSAVQRIEKYVKSLEEEVKTTKK
ncbi:Hypothetical protein R9X50_00725400 [Acrodontium crateriforme]|uniref:Uncharacterized protein n=1 Tax=Acrodontium crateriforme TaxID=150365 RepID=A0AAQ3RAL4_9PEZI|nr:Hypothetical protein R9X50_00725400 [Acrodontium crateriforme]